MTLIVFDAENVGVRALEMPKLITQPAITCSKSIIETLEQDVKYVQS